MQAIAREDDGRASILRGAGEDSVVLKSKKQQAKHRNLPREFPPFPLAQVVCDNA